ncbi:MAG: 2-oxo acid dehydrogenase subunit E2 [Thermomicrobiales bacterium]|nr:2-oxo acid dehydrogenase subunit E2 [Thermomicrobiales bacterium]MCO5224975.1 2-oxo acid dehydrogenase subunit E2 [Thermomicrobiales bacterium]MCO5227779.1 2-oxo acid dehydrogenase subunit E2 [Thermomicrobiales bacterium]
MAEVIMPKMGDAMEEGTLIKWLKAVGDEVAEGDALAEIETDKITLEMEAQESGFLTNIFADEGAVVPIGEVVATIGAQDEIGKGEKPAAAAAQVEAVVESGEPAAEADEEAAVVAGETPAAEAEAVERNEKFRASPLVKRLAEDAGLDLGLVSGSGPDGRIVKKDIQPYLDGSKALPTAKGEASAPVADAAPTRAAAPTYAVTGTKVDMPKIKRVTGDRMSESKGFIPHYYVSASIDMSAALDFRKIINAQLESAGIKVSVNDLIIKAAALSLVEHPNVNRSFVGGELYQQDSIDVNIAIAMDGGLIAPFIPAADQKSLGTISKMAKDLGKRAREGGLSMEEYQGGTFTISNLGMFDVDEFIAVINPPQVAILAVGSVAEVPVVRDGKIKVGHQMTITLSADHRALDGAEVASFLQSVRKYLENPMLLAVG